MITDKQFIDCFTAAGGWFLLTQFEKIYNWNGTKADLIDELFLVGFDNKRTGTTTRVSSVMRIIEEERGEDALIKIRDSKTINRAHPEAREWADELLRKYYGEK